MKKEIIIACLLVLLLSLAIVNIHFMNKLTDNITFLVEEAQEYAQAEDWPNAEKKAEEAARLWTHSDTYTHIVLRHSEIEEATDALFSFLEQIYAKEPGASKGAAKAATARLNSISSIEQIKLGSIF